MKFNLLYLFFGLSLALFILNSNSGGRANVANAGNTGAPGDQTTTCITCHGTSSTIQVDLDIEVADENGNSITNTGYVGGEEYDVTVTLNTTIGSPAGFGFQAIALTADLGQSGSQAGSWSEPGANVQISSAANGKSYAEHNNVSSSNEFKFKWTAPDAGTGVVTFYSCGNGVNDNGSTSGDGAACNTLVMQENTTSSINQLAAQANIRTFPNPVQEELQIDLNGEIAGEYEMLLIDVKGQVLSRRTITLIDGENRQAMDVRQLTPGLYALQVRGEKGQISRSIVKF